MPGHQFVDPLLWPAVDQAGEQIGNVSYRIDAAVELAGFDQRCQAGPIFTAFIRATEHAIFSG